MAALRPLILAAALLAAGCARDRVIDAPRPVEVRVPVPVRELPPEELLTPVPGVNVDAFVPAGDPRAVLGLTAEGAAAVHDLVEQLGRRIEALRAWAREPGG